MTDPPTLQRFLTTLDHRLAQMSADEIRIAIRAHAATLPSEQRGGFAEIFVPPAPVEDTAQADTAQLVWPVEDDALLDDIDDLVEQISSGAYYEGFGWDDEIHDQRSFGDESWVWEMDGLFDAAQAAFLAGDLGLARAAYERLLSAFDLDQEVGTFCGQSPPVEMVSTDIAEAEARYLRSVYETTQPAQRAAALSDEWFELPSYGAPTLAAVRESRPNDLPGLETFLPDWITELTSVAAEQPGATARVRPLLAEATELHGGADGLATLARTPGPGQGERFLDWVEALLRDGRQEDATDAAREALAVPSPYGDAYARVAERLAELSRDNGHALLEAQRAAWRARPTDQRLLALHAATPPDAVERVLAGDIEALNDGATQPDTAPPVSGRLRALLLLLAGRTHDAAALLGTADHSVDPAYRAVLPYLLAAGSRGPSLPQWATTRVAGLLRTIDEPWRSDWTSPTVSAHSTGDAPTLSDLLTARIAENAPTRPEQWLRSARAEIDRQVRVIVSGKHRRRYAEAARLAACCAEAYALAGDEAAGLEFIAALRGDFSRHSAFRRELDTATSDQPIAKIEPRR